MAETSSSENISPNEMCECVAPKCRSGLHPLIEWCGNCGKTI